MNPLEHLVKRGLANWTDGTKSEATTYHGAKWHRATVSDGSTTTQFLYDGDNVVADYNVGVAMTLTKSYVTPFLDQNVSMRIHSGEHAGTYYYTQDGLGSVRTMTNSSGVVVNKYDYQAFGEAYNGNTTATNTDMGTATTIDNRYTYTGREKNPVSGTYNNRNRNYKPALGRWSKRDPIGYEGGINIYGYVHAHPLMVADAYGKEPLTLTSVLVGVGIGIASGLATNIMWDKVEEWWGNNTNKIVNNLHKTPFKNTPDCNADKRVPKNCPGGTGSHTYKTKKQSVVAQIDVNWDYVNNGITSVTFTSHSKLGRNDSTSIVVSSSITSSTTVKDHCACCEQKAIIDIELYSLTLIDHTFPRSNRYEACGQGIQIDGQGNVKITKKLECTKY